MKKIIFALCAFGLMCSLYAKKARVEGVYKGYECQDYCYMGFYTDKGEMWFWYMSNLQDFAQNEANIGKRFVVNYEIKKRVYTRSRRKNINRAYRVDKEKVAILIYKAATAIDKASKRDLAPIRLKSTAPPLKKQKAKIALMKKDITTKEALKAITEDIAIYLLGLQIDNVEFVDKELLRIEKREADIVATCLINNSSVHHPYRNPKRLKSHKSD